MFSTLHPDRPRSNFCHIASSPNTTQGCAAMAVVNFTFEVVVAVWPLETLHPVNSQRSSPRSTQPNEESKTFHPSSHSKTYLLNLPKALLSIVPEFEKTIDQWSIFKEEKLMSMFQCSGGKAI